MRIPPSLISTGIVLLLGVPTVFASFDDTDGHHYADAIDYIQELEIVEGYEDGTYKPDQSISRSELLKIIVEAVYEDEFMDFDEEDCFTDVPVGEWYTPYACFAKEEGIVNGYEDGSFQPGQVVTYVEALKISMIGFGYEYEEGDPWYQLLLDVALENQFVANDVTSADMEMSRAQMAELITRILKYNEDELEDYLERYSFTYSPYDPIEEDDELAENFLSMINTHRIENGLWALQVDEDLNAVAQSHSEWMKAEDTMSHEDAEGNHSWDRCEAAGTECSGENLATMGIHASELLFEVWRDSPPHNANMLGDYEYIGIGMAGNYFTTVFR